MFEKELKDNKRIIKIYLNRLRAWVLFPFIFLTPIMLVLNVYYLLPLLLVASHLYIRLASKIYNSYMGENCLIINARRNEDGMLFVNLEKFDKFYYKLFIIPCYTSHDNIKTYFNYD